MQTVTKNSSKAEQSLELKYKNEIDEMQNKYDLLTEHNVELQSQNEKQADLVTKLEGELKRIKDSHVNETDKLN